MNSQSPIDDLWMVSREYDGLAGAGGVKDVVRQAAEAAVAAGTPTTVVLPAYGFIDLSGFHPTGLVFQVDMDYAQRARREEVRVLTATLNGVRLFLLDSDRFREKNGVYTYTEADERANPYNRRGTGHFDYFAMNVLLQKGALATAARLGRPPAVFHCHDGHTALIPAMVREMEGYRHFYAATGCLVTIHNAGRGYHQEVDDLPFACAVTGLPPRVIYDNLLDSGFDPLLAAGNYALLNTVSENYARELQETDLDEITGWLGHRLLARGVRLAGITNGINPAHYDPRRPERLGLAAAFDPGRGDLAGKAVCRRRLAEELAAGELTVRRIGSLEDDEAEPLFTMVGRLTSQKGVDKLAGCLETLLHLDPGMRLVVLGTGEPAIENDLAGLARRREFVGRFCLLLGYDQDLAMKIYAGGDFFLVPSRFEPCGLTDFIAQLLGNLPVVHHTGGLVKVRHLETGFAYQEHSSAGLMGAMQLAAHTFRQDKPLLRRMQQQAVAVIHQHYTWEKVIQRYFDLYRETRRGLAGVG